MPTAEELDSITTLLKQGKVQEAADLSAKLSAETKAAEDLAAGKVAEPPPPREPNIIFDDLLGAIVSHLGNRHDMVALLEEWRLGMAAHGMLKAS